MNLRHNKPAYPNRNLILRAIMNLQLDKEKPFTRNVKCLNLTGAIPTTVKTSDYSWNNIS
jgi:hypothetical protein